jgi:hypothetical protein
MKIVLENESAIQMRRMGPSVKIGSKLLESVKKKLIDT